jgi:ankyrin repeat protein
MKRLNLLIIPLTVFGVTNPKRTTNTNLIEPLKTVPVQTQVLDRGYLNDLLLAAIDSGDYAEVADVLKNHEIDVNNNDHTYIPILQHAITAGGDQADKIVELLLKAGAKVNSQDMLGFTPLMLVADSRRKNTGQIAQLLISHGAKLNLKNTIGQTALEIAQAIGNQAVITKIQTAMTAE